MEHEREILMKVYELHDAIKLTGNEMDDKKVLSANTVTEVY